MYTNWFPLQRSLQRTLTQNVLVHREGTLDSAKYSFEYLNDPRDFSKVSFIEISQLDDCPTSGIGNADSSSNLLGFLEF